VVGIYKYGALNDALGSIHIGTRGQALVFGPSGTVVAYTNHAVQAGTNLGTLRGSGYTAVQNWIVSGEIGAAKADTGEDKMFLAFSPIRGTQWSLVVEMPRSDYAYLTNRAMLVTFAAALVLMFLSALWSTRTVRSIFGPIGKVTDWMVKLSDGDLHSDVEQIHSQDELELLSATLNGTVSNLNHYIMVD